MGPVELLLVRHGESLGNVARVRAKAEGAPVMDIEQRDADVALTDLGRRQSAALGRWLSALPADRRPEAVWSSPYRRTADTAAIALDVAGLDLPVRTDERLRDREMGILDRLTGAGIAEQHPDEGDRWRWHGKFYYRPPGGEAWTDVALRVRSVLADLDRFEDGRRVLVVCHDAVVYLTRYVCEQLSEPDLVRIAGDVVGNASVTRLVRPAGAVRWTLDGFDIADHLVGLDEAGEAGPAGSGGSAATTTAGRTTTGEGQQS